MIQARQIWWVSNNEISLKKINMLFLSTWSSRKVTTTPVRHTLQPLCDLSATDNFHQSQRSQQGPRSVPARLQRSRRLVGDLAATKSVAARFLNMLKRLAATDLSPSQTYTATALRPLHDWQFPPIAEVATRSPIGPGEVAEMSATSRRPRCDQISRSQVFEHAQKPGCVWFGRRQVPARSPTSPRSLAD